MRKHQAKMILMVASMAILLSLISVENALVGPGNGQSRLALADRGLFIKNAGQVCKDVSYYLPNKSGTIFVTNVGSLGYNCVDPLRASMALAELSKMVPGNFTRTGWAITETPVPVSYEASGNEYFFKLGNFDPCLPLVIDPLIRTSYLGGAGNDYAYTIDVHQKTGDVYLAGYAESVDFPGRAHGEPFMSSPPDIFLARVDSQLTKVHEIIFLRGNGADACWAIALDERMNELFLSGHTTSSDFPGTKGGGDEHLGGKGDGFLARFSIHPLQLKQATYIGGSGEDFASDLVLNPVTGDVYATGYSNSKDLPGTPNGAQPGNAGKYDVFIARFNKSLTQVKHVAYLGGSGDDSGNDIAVEKGSGDIYVTGLTSSSDFPRVAGGAQSSIASSYDAFVTRLDSSLSTILQSTYFGGEGYDESYGMAIDENEHVLYFTGETASAKLLGTSNAAQARYAGGSRDAFVCKCDLSLRKIEQCTYFGGTGNEAFWTLAIPGDRKLVFATGYSSSRDLPGSKGGAQQTFGGGNTDAVVVSFDTGLKRIIQSTYLGGSGNEYNYGVVYCEKNGLVYTGGDTSSMDYPLTSGSFQAVFGGGNYDGAVAVLMSDLKVRARSHFLIRPPDAK